MSEPIDAKALQAALGPGSRWAPVSVVERTGSTNADLLGQIRTGQGGPGAVIVAAEQHSGRGRLTRSWSSPPGASVALSAAVACPPPLPSAFLPLVAGLAVAQAGRDLGAKTFLKWPNDVLIGEHKWCGILVESTRAPGGGLVAVVGIGLNVSQTAEQLPVPTATSLALAGAAASRPAAAAAVLNRLGSLVTEWERGEDLLPRCRALSATLGKEVAVGLGAETVRGRAADIANDGRLGVIVDGQLRYFAAGDVEHLRAI